MAKLDECTCPSRQLLIGLPDGETHSIMCPMRRKDDPPEDRYDSMDDDDYQHMIPFLDWLEE
jgi:hypothetical protein